MSAGLRAFLRWESREKEKGVQNMAERLMTIKQVAKYLHLGPTTIYNYAQKRKIPAIKVGRNWRFRPEDIETWLEGNRKVSP